MMVLVMVVVTGLTAGLAGSSWRSIMQQVKEQELLWRGDQYRDAIASYYKVSHSGIQRYPASLEDLLRDPRSLQPVRQIRRLYPDPMTGADWAIIKDPAGGIRGVRSSSEEKPFKKDGFDEEHENFKNRMRYSEWEFSYTPPSKSSGATPEGSGARRSGFFTNQ
jgi:type II secretory pathway pseudopilin PulG